MAATPLPRTQAYTDMTAHKNMATFEALGRQGGLLEAFQVTAERGVDASAVYMRRQGYGANKLPPVDRLTFFDFIKEALEDKTMLILIGAAVVSLILGMTTPDPRTGEVDRSTGWIEGFAILVSIVIVTVVSSLNNYQKQEQFSELMAEGNKLRAVTVRRDGVWVDVADEDVVVGDIALLQLGMQLSFDAILLEDNNNNDGGEGGLVCDEMNITGERGEVHKSITEDPFIISGTSVVEGSDAIGLVVAVGEQSFAGAISMAVRDGKKNTPLQEQLEEMADTIGKFGLAAALFTFAALFLKELYVMMFLGGKFYAMKLFDNITTAVAIVVVAVPEGLPLSVTISLAYSMRRMLADGNLVRHLAACETMGGATVVCSDKTGTITEPNMILTSVFLEGKTISCASFANADPLLLSNSGCSPATIQLLLDSVALTCGSKRWSGCSAHQQGNKTSEALSVIAAASQKLSPQSSTPYDATVTLSQLPKNAFRRFAFSSQRKQSSIVVRGHGGERLVHYVCGAAEMVLQQCNMYVGANGQRHPLTAELRRQHENVILEFTRQRGLRTLCLAYSEKAVTGYASSSSSGAIQGGGGPGLADFPVRAPTDVLTLIGIAGLEEPVRPDVAEAVRSCRRAGMQVMMVTGDNLSTAVNIAQRCGMLIADSTTSAVTLDGPTFRSLSDDDLVADVLPNLVVLARATPLDKQRLVTLLKRNPATVVAVTGDGTNDAPALKAADVGFSMFSGSDVAKRASDIVLLTDNFSGMVKAAMWGRNVRDNIRKFLQFQLTVNVAACIVAFFGAVMNHQNMSPLKPVQLLWLNLIMDTLAALALATELPCERVLLSRSPEPKDAPIINRYMWINVSFQATFQLFVQVLLLAVAHRTFDVEYFGIVHLTIVFNVFVLLQVFNFFNARMLSADGGVLDNLANSRTLLRIVLCIAASQCAMVEYGGKFMGTTPLTVSQWGYCIAVGSSSLVVGWWTRWLIRRQVRRGGDLLPMPGWISSMMRKVNLLKKS
jgi:P-type Ca2+ transporter type 2C